VRIAKEPSSPPLILGILAIALLLFPSIARSAIDLYTELPPELARYDSRREIHIHSAQEAKASRDKVVRFLWNDGLPVHKMPSIKPVYSGGGGPLPADLVGLNAANIASAQRWQANMDFQYATAMYLLHPAKNDNAARLVIVTHGHCADYNSRFGAGIGPLIDDLLKNGFSVLAMQMPLHGWNTQNEFRLPSGTVKAADHNQMVKALEGKGGSALRFFIEPVVQAVNQFTRDHPHADVSMIGLSGGGWTTVLAAAVDPRIKLSLSVSGSMPIYARPFYPGSVGDAEQSLPALYEDRASYLDLYILDSFGKGRRHIQIGNQYDDGCFYGVSHTTWAANVKKAVASTREGTYDFSLDSTHRQHQISKHAVQDIINPALGLQ
jgi:hypothetical protein